MGVNVLIIDPKTGAKASIDPAHDRRGKHAVVVAQRDLYEYENTVVYFTHPTHGFNLNKDFTTGGGSEIDIYDGTDNSYWTATSVVGSGWDFTSTTQAHTGTKSIDATGTANNDQCKFNPSPLTPISLVDGNALEGWIYITGWPVTGTKEVDFQFYLSGTAVGSIVGVSGYVTISNTGVWQKFVIPLVDFGVVGLSVDDIRLTTVDLGPGSPPDYYIDDLIISYTTGGTGLGTQEFTAHPSPNSEFYVTVVNFIVADTISGVLADSTMLNIDYSTFMGLTLNSGVIYSRIIQGVSKLGLQIKQLGDLMLIPGASLKTAWYSSASTEMFLVFSVDFEHPICLDYENNDYLRVTLSDDYSDLSYFRIVIGGRTLDWNKFQKEETKRGQGI